MISNKRPLRNKHVLVCPAVLNKCLFVSKPAESFGSQGSTPTQVCTHPITRCPGSSAKCKHLAGDLKTSSVSGMSVIFWDSHNSRYSAPFLNFISNHVSWLEIYKYMISTQIALDFRILLFKHWTLFKWCFFAIQQTLFPLHPRGLQPPLQCSCAAYPHGPSLQTLVFPILMSSFDPRDRVVLA